MKLSISTLEAQAPRFLPGYVDDYLSSAYFIGNGFYEITEYDRERLRSKWNLMKRKNPLVLEIKAPNVQGSGEKAVRSFVPRKSGPSQSYVIKLTRIDKDLQSASLTELRKVISSELSGDIARAGIRLCDKQAKLIASANCSVCQKNAATSKVRIWLQKRREEAKMRAKVGGQDASIPV